MVTDPDIEKIFAQNLSLDETSQALIDAANANGGKDNITVILLKAEN
jgi:protein phosphatase